MAGTILNITCNPEIECSQTGTISDFENIYPGFQTTRKISITNNRDTQCDLQIKTQNGDLNNPIFKHTTISFSNNGVLPPKHKTDLEMRLYVSNKADNNFANQSAKVDFNFKINCVPSATSSGTVAGISTTTNRSFNWWWLFIFLALLIFISRFKFGKKN